MWLLFNKHQAHPFHSPLIKLNRGEKWGYLRVSLANDSQSHISHNSTWSEGICSRADQSWTSWVNSNHTNHSLFNSFIKSRNLTLSLPTFLCHISHLFFGGSHFLHNFWISKLLASSHKYPVPLHKVFQQLQWSRFCADLCFTCA